MTPPFPPDRHESVQRALQAAFGTTVLDSVAPLTGGLSGSHLYRIRVGGIAYVLRLESPGDAFRDPKRGYVCMQAAAAAFLAPCVRYASATDGVAIMDLVEQKSVMLEYARSRDDLIRELAQGVRALHATPPFPPLVDYLDGVGLLTDQLASTGRLADAAMQAVRSAYAGLRSSYRSDPADLVSSHNDLNPGNVIFDGRRLWMIDWETAFLADRYVDLAAVAGWFTSTPQEEAHLLTAYFGAPATSVQTARMAMVREVSNLFYGVIFLLGAIAERPEARLGELSGPSLTSLHRSLGGGTFGLQAWDDRVAYGKARLSAALSNLSGDRCREAAALLAA